jgi:hypothetical protein
MKVEFIYFLDEDEKTSYSPGDLTEAQKNYEKSINELIADKEVIDIKYQPWSVLIMYK